jgi:hypothetical protein
MSPCCSLSRSIPNMTHGDAPSIWAAEAASALIGVRRTDQAVCGQGQGREVGSGCPGVRGQPRDSKTAPYAKLGQGSGFPAQGTHPPPDCVCWADRLFRQRRARSGYARLCATSRGRRHGMAEHDLHQHVEISNGDRTVAAAEVITSPGSEGTARASLRAESGHITPGSRASLWGSEVRFGP